VTVVEGSTTQSGTIQILTRGTAQTIETIMLPDGQRSVVYSNGNAKELSEKGASASPLEQIVTDQCADFPLPFLLSILNTSEEAYRYIGQEVLDGASVQHIQVWNTFSSRPPMQKLASFSTRDMWFDTSSGLPLKIAYSRRTGGGSLPAFPVDGSDVVRKLLKLLIESRAGWTICGEAVDGEEALRKSRELKPDLIILDLAMSGLNDLLAAREISTVLPSVPILLHTVNNIPA